MAVDVAWELRRTVEELQKEEAQKAHQSPQGGLKVP